jgi:homocitrate synthase NifV
MSSVRITLRDSTLREGLDTPGVAFSADDRRAIARSLAAAGVPEIEVAAPARFEEGVRAASDLAAAGIAVRKTGLVYANGKGPLEQVAAGAALDHVDLLMPLSPKRPPHDEEAKRRVLLEVLAEARRLHPDVGIGLPHSTQAAWRLVVELAADAADAGASRITLYDTNGSSDPSATGDLVAELSRRVERSGVPVFFHAHNDLGMATANAWAAVRAGARGLDVTVNGLGDRAGNASLEQLVVLLALHGFDTGVDPRQLRELSRAVEERSGVPVSPLAPVVGAYAFDHRSPAHLPAPGEFEAFDPDLVGSARRLDASAAPSATAAAAAAGARTRP